MKAALYARVSTREQHVGPQLEALRAWAAGKGVSALEFVDHGVSGTKASRPGLDALLAACRRGEVQTVVVAALDRLGRSMPHLVAVAEELKALSVELVSLRESIDTRTPTGRALFGMLAVCAQLERDWIAERIAVGVAAAKRAGKRVGRPPALAGDALEQAQRQARAGWSVRRIAAFHRVSRDAVSRALRVVA